MTLLEQIQALPGAAALIAARDDAAIAAALSVGRTRRKHPVMISERGVRALLPATQASPLLRLLRDASQSVGVPAWFTATLTAVGVPEPMHQDYADNLGSAWHWLLDSDGIDVSSDASIAMLDLIAAYDAPKFGAAVATLKALSVVPDPVSVNAVSDALNAGGY